MKSEIAFIQRKVAPHGGGEMFALRFLGELKKMGHKITIFAHFANFSFLDQVDFVRIPILKPFSFLKMLSFAWFCKRAAKRKNYELIFSNERTVYHDIYFAGEGCHSAWLQQRFRQVGAIKKFLIGINPLHWTILYLEKRCITNSRLLGIISFSQRVQEELIKKHKLPADKIKVVYHGVPAPVADEDEIERNTMRQDLGIGKNELVILFIGSGFERKGLRFLIEGLAHFDYPAFRLCVVGKGKTGKYRKCAQRLGLQDKVHFYGQNPHVRLFYSIADIFVLPTIYEPFGLVVLEAMSYNIPVVVSQYAGAAELITHGEDGLILKNPFDPKEIGQCLNQLKDSGFRQTLAKAGNHLASQYTLQKNTRDTLKAVEEFKVSSKKSTA